MASSRGSKHPMEKCLVCDFPQPQGKFHEFPWHLTCAYDEAGRKKIAVWKREQKTQAKAEIPQMEL
jgi:hypothetical protein